MMTFDLDANGNGYFRPATPEEIARLNAAIIATMPA